MNLRRILRVVIVPLLLAFSLYAQSRPEVIRGIDKITTEDQLSEWLTYYYLHPKPQLVVSAVQFMSTQGHLQEGHAQTPFCVFLAQVFAANTSEIDTWFGQLRKGTEDEKSALALVLWMVETGDNKDMLTSLGKDGSAGFQNYVHDLLADHRPPDLIHDEIRNAGFLDALWASFFASGDERYVKRIISALPLVQEKGDVQRMLIGGAARWSLASNAYQHPKVMEICEAQLKELPADQRAALAEVIKTARERQQ
jgi:hypothetical protein